MAGDVVFQGKATLNITDYLAELKRLRSETQAVANEIRTAFKGIASGISAANTAISARQSTATNASQRRADADARRIERDRERAEERQAREQSKSDSDRFKQIEAAARKAEAAARKTERDQQRQDAKRARDEATAANRAARQQAATERTAARLAERQRVQQERAYSSGQADMARQRRAQSRRSEYAQVRADAQEHAVQMRRIRDAQATAIGTSPGASRGSGAFFGGAAFEGLSDGMDKWARAMKTVEDRFNSLFRAGAQIQDLSYTIGMLTAGMSALGISLYKTASDFDAWIKKAYSAAQAAGEVGVSVKQFEATAHRVAQAVGSFNPADVAEAMYHWQSAMGGVISTEEDLIETETALTSVLMAGAIAKIDSTVAIRGIANVLKEFELGSNRALDVTAKLLNASQISAVEFPELLESYKMIGPIAHSMGVSLEEILALTTALSDVGQRGTMAGRGLQQVVTSLIKPSREAAEAMDMLFQRANMGTHREVFFQKDADGIERFIGLLDKGRVVNGEFIVEQEGLLAKLSKATQNLTESEKQHFLATITSQNGMRALIPLLGQYEGGANAINKRLVEFIDHQGQIALFSETQWKTYSGTIEVAFGQQINRIKELAIEIGNAVAYGLLPFLRYVADGAQLILQWVRANPTLVASLITLTTAFVGIGVAIAGVLFFVGQYLQAFTVIRLLGSNLGLMLGALTSSWLGFSAVLITLLGVIIMFANGVKNNAYGMQQVVTEVSKYFTSVIAGIVQSISNFIKMIDAMLRGDWEAAWSFAAAIFSSIGVLIETAILNLIPMVLSAIGSLLESIGRTIDQFIPGFSTWGKSLIISFANGIVQGAVFVVNAVLSVIEFISGFLESHSPPEQGPLRFIESWGMELMNTYLRGMQKADFGVVNEIASAIEKHLESQLKSGAISPGDYFTRNMAARQLLTQHAAKIRHFSETGKDPVTDEDRARLASGLRSYMGTGNEFANRMMDAYVNVAPLQMVIELEKDKLQTIKDQKDVLEAQLDVRKAELNLANLGDNEALRMKQLELDIVRARNDVAESGLHNLPSSRANAAENARRQAARDALKGEEARLRAEIAEISLRTKEREFEYLRETAPKRLEAARLQLEAEKKQAEINQKIADAKPWVAKLEAAKAALDFEEKSYALAKKSADEAERKTKATLYGDTGDGGKALAEKQKKVLEKVDEDAKKWAENFRLTIQKGFDNSLKPFTQFTEDVENRRKEMEKTLNLWRGGVQDFFAAIGALLKGENPMIAFTKQAVEVDEWVEEGADGGLRRKKKVRVVNKPRNVPQWVRDLFPSYNLEDGAEGLDPEMTYQEGNLNKALGTAQVLGGAFGVGMLGSDLYSRWQATNRARALDKHVTKMGLLGADAEGNLISMFGKKGVSLSGSNLLYELGQLEPGILKQAEVDMQRFGRLRASTTVELQKSKLLAEIIKKTDGVLDVGMLRDLRRMREINPALLADMVETGRLPFRGIGTGSIRGGLRGIGGLGSEMLSALYQGLDIATNESDMVDFGAHVGQRPGLRYALRHAGQSVVEAPLMQGFRGLPARGWNALTTPVLNALALQMGVGVPPGATTPRGLIPNTLQNLRNIDLRGLGSSTWRTIMGTHLDDASLVDAGASPRARRGFGVIPRAMHEADALFDIARGFVGGLPARARGISIPQPIVDARAFFRAFVEPDAQRMAQGVSTRFGAIRAGLPVRLQAMRGRAAGAASSLWARRPRVIDATTAQRIMGLPARARQGALEAWNRARGVAAGIPGQMQGRAQRAFQNIRTGVPRRAQQLRTIMTGGARGGIGTYYWSAEEQARRAAALQTRRSAFSGGRSFLQAATSGIRVPRQLRWRAQAIAQSVGSRVRAALPAAIGQRARATAAAAPSRARRIFQQVAAVGGGLRTAASQRAQAIAQSVGSRVRAALPAAIGQRARAAQATARGFAQDLRWTGWRVQDSVTDGAQQLRGFLAGARTGDPTRARGVIGGVGTLYFSPQQRAARMAALQARRQAFSQGRGFLQTATSGIRIPSMAQAGQRAQAVARGLGGAVASKARAVGGKVRTAAIPAPVRALAAKASAAASGAAGKAKAAASGAAGKASAAASGAAGKASAAASGASGKAKAALPRIDQGARAVQAAVKGAPGRAVAGARAVATSAPARIAGRAASTGASAGLTGIKAMAQAVGALVSVLARLVGLNHQFNMFVLRAVSIGRIAKVAGPILSVFGGIARFAGMIIGIGPAASGFMRIFRVFFKFIPILGWILLAIDIIKTLYDVWTTNFAGIRTAVTEAYDVIAPAINAIVDAIDKLFKGQINFKQFLDNVGPEFTKIWNSLGKMFTDIGKGLLGELTKLLKSIWDWLSTTGVQIAKDVAAWAFNMLIDAGKWLWDNKQEIIEKFFSTIIGLFLTGPSVIWKLIKWIASDGIPALKQVFQDLFVGSVGGDKEQTSFVEKIKNWFVGAFNGIVDWVKRGGLIDLVTKIGEAFLDVGSAIVRGILMGIAKAFGIDQNILLGALPSFIRGSGKPTSGAGGGPGTYHGGGAVNQTGYHFLDAGEYVISGPSVQNLLLAATDMRNLTYRIDHGYMTYPGPMNVGGKVVVDVNLHGNASQLTPRMKDDIAETVIRGITASLSRR